MLWARYVSIPTGRLAQISRFLLRTVRLMKTVHCQCVRCSAKMPNSGSTSLDFGITSQLDWSNKIRAVNGHQVFQLYTVHIRDPHPTVVAPTDADSTGMPSIVPGDALRVERGTATGPFRSQPGERCANPPENHTTIHIPRDLYLGLSDRNIENGSFKDTASAASVLFLMCSSKPIGFAENCHQIIANLTKQPCPVPFAKKQLPIVAGTARGSVKCAIRCGSTWRPKAKCWPSVVWRHRAA